MLSEGLKNDIKIGVRSHVAMVPVGHAAFRREIEEFGVFTRRARVNIFTK